MGECLSYLPFSFLCIYSWISFHSLVHKLSISPFLIAGFVVQILTYLWFKLFLLDYLNFPTDISIHLP